MAKTKEETVSSLELTKKIILKKYGDGALVNSTTNRKFDHFSSQSVGVDYVLGGGWARGRIVEAFGPASSGKTTTALHACAEIQRIGENAAFIDMEHALDISYAKNLNVDTDKLLMSQPDNAEQALDIIELLIKSNEISLVVLDSVAALVPRAEIEGEMGSSHVGLQARLMSQAMRKLTGLCRKTNTTILFLNQIRMKIGVLFGSPEVVSGGEALKFYASQRLDIRRRKIIQKESLPVGNETHIKCVKNKVAPPFRETDIRIMYGKGIDNVFTLVNLAVDMGIMERSGAWYSYKEENIGQGVDKTGQSLLENKEILNEIQESVYKILLG